MSKQTNPARTCADCLHCQACHLWSSGAISDSVAPKCPQFTPARYASLAELQDLYRMYKGELVPVVHGRWVKSNKHIWRKTKSGEVDEFWYEYDYHNGPGCEVCGFSFCEHCDPEKWDDETCQDHYICSVCGRIEMKAEPYCNCGAKMDGGAVDG